MRATLALPSGTALAGIALGGLALAAASPALAEQGIGTATLRAVSTLGASELTTLAVIVGVVTFAVVAAIGWVRTDRSAGLQRQADGAEIASLQSDIDRLATLLMSEPQVLVVWTAGLGEPEVIGEASFIAPTLAPHDILAFDQWLEPDLAAAVTDAIDRLRVEGEAFALLLTTILGRHVEAEGRPIGGFAVMKLRNVSGIKRDLAEFSVRCQKLQSEADAMRSLIEMLPAPVWMRDGAGQLQLVNAAYARAVEAPDATVVLGSGTELLDTGERETVARTLAAGREFRGRLPAIVAGSRRVMDVLEVPVTQGRIGIAIDATEAERLRAELDHILAAHRRTLDHLATGVAIFGADRRLAFYNTAYRTLWDLDPAFLAEQPSDGQVLDRLRTARRLPEQKDFREWKRELHRAYHSRESEAHEWHLPDRRTLRVVTTPNPEGGVTYLFDDITERLELERRFDALIRVQGETLDNLAEAVAVFGSDGRLRLFNPAFANTWKLPPSALAQHPHIEQVIGLCRPLYRDDETWHALRSAVTALDSRDPISGRIERSDGSVMDFATVPLPDGSTLVTFHDVTDSVNVERALRERNEALVAADELKLDFVHHVSYELRSPLTNIIGFAHFLGDPSTGPLTEKQDEYLGYITVSTNALLAIINNILDLATIDAGAMTLNPGPVDIRATMEAAVEGVQDRLVKHDIALDLIADPAIGDFQADGRRIRQVLFNLLSNAIGFSPPGGRVTLTAERTDSAVVFTVSDEGPGIPPEMADKVFDWFESDSQGSGHRGVGLGLSIVRSFVELHGGTVRIDSAVGGGATVVCSFPLVTAAARTAAE
ncbi:sensor protein [Rhodovulum sp. PH10]|uniref:PAS domain-containing sensor histidine kinase n=1 Tax=Rhodovulum sp. PH10 TaxID=1187851 RepID=UPI00027C20E6|nr:PAS domain-containing sensor histidine kinase [Rhodovulum sp. PH10]EJW09590.1 sensor protein [Rhodovulum sp. PH10]